MTAVINSLMIGQFGNFFGHYIVGDLLMLATTVDRLSLHRYSK